MVQTTNWKEFKIETPARYRIRVQGRIDPSFSGLIDDMNIETDSTTGKNVVTTLVGYMVDQAALTGVLKEIYDLRIPLLSVENLDEKRKNKNEKIKK